MAGSRVRLGPEAGSGPGRYRTRCWAWWLGLSPGPGDCVCDSVGMVDMVTGKGDEVWSCGLVWMLGLSLVAGSESGYWLYRGWAWSLGWEAGYMEAHVAVRRPSRYVGCFYSTPQFRPPTGRRRRHEPIRGRHTPPTVQRCCTMSSAHAGIPGCAAGT